MINILKGTDFMERKNIYMYIHDYTRCRPPGFTK